MSRCAARSRNRCKARSLSIFLHYKEPNGPVAPATTSTISRADTIRLLETCLVAIDFSADFAYFCSGLPWRFMDTYGPEQIPRRAACMTADAPITRRLLEAERGSSTTAGFSLYSRPSLAAVSMRAADDRALGCQQTQTKRRSEMITKRGTKNGCQWSAQDQSERHLVQDHQSAWCLLSNTPAARQR